MRQTYENWMKKNVYVGIQSAISPGCTEFFQYEGVRNENTMAADRNLAWSCSEHEENL